MEKSIGFDIGSKKSKKKFDFEGVLNDFFVKMSSLEDQIFEVKNQLESGEDGVSNVERKVKGELEVFRKDLLDLKQIVEDVKSDIAKINEEVGRLARVTDLEVLYKYVKMWDPMSFVRREELDRVLENEGIKKRKI